MSMELEAEKAVKPKRKKPVRIPQEFLSQGEEEKSQGEEKLFDEPSFLSFGEDSTKKKREREQQRERGSKNSPRFLIFQRRQDKGVEVFLKIVWWSFQVGGPLLD